MTLALVAAGLATVLLPDPAADRVIAQVLVTPGEMNAREAAAWMVMGEALREGSRDYTAGEVFAYGSQAGQRPRFRITPESLRVEIAAPPGGADLALDLLSSVVLRPNLAPADLAAARDRLAQAQRDPWRRALVPWNLPFDRVRERDVREAWARAVQPGTTVVGLAGRFESDTAAAMIAQRFTEWPARPPRAVADLPLTSAGRQAGRVGSLELRLPSLSADASPARLLAAIALGSGKGGLLHRLIRERLGWSYRQELVLWPTRQGWTPRLIVLRQETSADPVTGLRLKQTLREGVAAWTQVDLDRARGFAPAALSGRSPLSPVWLDDFAPIDDSLSARLAVGLWERRLGKAILARDFSSVTLEELKSAAVEMLDAAMPLALPEQ